MIQLYNSLSGKKEPLPEPKEQKKIRLFVCGPTVYDYLHIGNARTYVFFDFFAKYLRSQGYEVNYLQNITDIDDKIIKRAAEENKKPEAVAELFTKAYFEDMKTLGVDAVTEYAPATKFITQIVAQVERLIDKGFAYKIEGDGWYFDIAKDPDYGKLSHRTVEQAEDATSRIDDAANKRNKGDFCLWKFSKTGAEKNSAGAENEPSWMTSLGAGRPGWHIEDTAISEFYFGPQYEIHGGGVDLKFPHHEAEIAQQESASGLKPFVKYWMHTGALLVDSKKMSKSLGNFVTIRDFLKKYPAEVLRLMVFSHHYQSPMDYTEKSADDARTALNNLMSFLGKIDFALRHHDASSTRSHELEFPAIVQSALENDLNTPDVVAITFHTMYEANKFLWELDKKSLETAAAFIKKTLTLFGIAHPSPKIPANIEKLAAERELSRANKQFAESDRLRKEMNDLGYDIEDTPRGPFVWPKSLWQPKNPN
jgi:cysteinyl-tRNA synthetase